MVARIRELDKTVADQIAAGEVVQRPASVVKELVENAIDSGATSIDIDILQGGLVSIRVADNGCGMSQDDLPLAVKRHATSKLSEISDLEALRTLGFRGEALASISSVSRMTVISKEREGTSLHAMEIEINGGQTGEVRKAARDCGTTVTVNDLFYNVPARRKFLKKEITEFAHIAEVIECAILAFPAIRFRLSHNNRLVMRSPGNGDLFSAVSSVLPQDLTAKLIELRYAHRDATVHGFIGSPVCSREDRSRQYFFVNNRYVYNSTIVRALEDAYRNVLEVRKKPVGLIFLSIAPSDVDVNVHPAKREVKFRDSTQVYQTVKTGVVNALRLAGTDTAEIDHRQDAISNMHIEKTILPSANTAGHQAGLPLTHISGEQQVQVRASNLSVIAGGLAPVRIMQIMRTYIIRESQSGLEIFDQHALHERILFERMKQREQHSIVQKLLVPEMVFLSKAEVIQLQDLQDVFMETGFGIEFFGSDCVLVREVPEFLADSDIAGIVRQVVSDVLTVSKGETIERLREDLYKVMACRGAVKAGDALSTETMERILTEAEATPNSATCPHGRPTRVQFDGAYLEKLFHRR